MTKERTKQLSNLAVELLSYTSYLREITVWEISDHKTLPDNLRNSPGADDMQHTIDDLVDVCKCLDDAHKLILKILER